MNWWAVAGTAVILITLISLIEFIIVSDYMESVIEFISGCLAIAFAIALLSGFVYGIYSVLVTVFNSIELG